MIELFSEDKKEQSFDKQRIKSTKLNTIIV